LDQIHSCDDGLALANGDEYVLKSLALRNKFLILDDICDGGATFLAVVEALKKRVGLPIMEFHLFVSHGIFSKGRKVLEEQGIQIYTTNSLLHNTDGIEVSHERHSPSSVQGLL
jgi:phosphoribosylpyrophosphate synthetase